MNEPVTPKIPDSNELDAAQVETAAAGGADYCTPENMVGITESLIQAYENLVDFTSHVIGRVAGEN